jgi:hypothetical protein
MGAQNMRAAQNDLSRLVPVVLVVAWLLRTT